MRRTHVISARRTVAPRAGPDPRQQRPVLNGAAICLRAGWTGALGPAGLGAPSLCPHWLRALVSLSVPLAPTFRVLSEPVAVGGGPASLAVCSPGPTAPAWAPSRCGRRCGLHGGFGRRTGTQRCEPRAEGARAGPVGGLGVLLGQCGPLQRQPRQDPRLPPWESPVTWVSAAGSTEVPRPGPGGAPVLHCAGC